MRQVVSKSNYVREAEGDHPSMGRHDASKVPHRRRKPSSEVPLLKQSELSSKNTPELIQVFGMDENLAATGKRKETRLWSSEKPHITEQESI
ncbi:hypothetical protein ElyMa_005650800 [Elysia marginata]|uniref:Uncharacterized protein n=1 Tax=Elysia marginata TaxID=1093978 RepID=A0AAV4FAH4_9GAST|nr:hypothetical protein ElyMa_005650800 [Elysia marginata]